LGTVWAMLTTCPGGKFIFLEPSWQYSVTLKWKGRITGLTSPVGLTITSGAMVRVTVAFATTTDVGSSRAASELSHATATLQSMLWVYWWLACRLDVWRAVTYPASRGVHGTVDLARGPSAGSAYAAVSYTIDILIKVATAVVEADSMRPVVVL
jgi:hypothetical protein